VKGAFIDLLRFLAGAEIVSVQAMMMGEGVGIRDDKVTIHGDRISAISAGMTVLLVYVFVH